MALDNSTIFRFVTIRGPRKPTDKEIESGFVRYEAKVKLAVVDAHLTKSRRDALEVAQRFKQSHDFATTPEQLEERQKDLVRFGDWLRAEVTCPLFPHAESYDTRDLRVLAG